jgi:site-specific DNA recombinase
VRRIKQGVAEYFRLQLKKKTWDGLREHSIAGWNIGVAPYGYTADRTGPPWGLQGPAGQDQDPPGPGPPARPRGRGHLLWRTEQRLGIPAITARLNASHGQYPPPAGGRWLESTVGAILGNPKYTGHMVFGRRRKTGRTHIAVPPDRWIWSPEPAHPAIISRELWDQAQAIGWEHRSASDALPSTQPRARRNYPLRSRVRCNLCQRRMCGVTRYTTRDHAADPGARHICYNGRAGLVRGRGVRPGQGVRPPP